MKVVATNNGNSHVDKKSRFENNFDDRNSDDDGDEKHYQQFRPLSQTQTEIGDNTKTKTKKIHREAKSLSSYNHSPPETSNHETIRIEKPQHRLK